LRRRHVQEVSHRDQLRRIIPSVFDPFPNDRRKQANHRVFGKIQLSTSTPAARSSP
jgi:hypothetical protein